MLKVGGRYLINRILYPSVSEVHVIELSPTGEYIKFNVLGSDIIWIEKDKINILCELPDCFCKSLEKNLNKWLNEEGRKLGIEPIIEVPLSVIKSIVEASTE